MQIDSELYLYHEKQDAGLCAVHALNALLQGPYFSEIDLMHIAKEFDENERKLMLESGAESKEYLKFMAEDSGNLAEDGNYSIQVISKALEVWNLHPIPITNPEARTAKVNPLKENAFICNLLSHWLTVRRVGENWFNLNSLLTKPEYLSPFYLSAFLDTLMMSGYTVFVIRGDLPRVVTDTEALKDHCWKKAPLPNPKQENPDEDLEKALIQSELEAALQFSLQSASQKDTSNPLLCDTTEEEDDEELQEAIRLSQEIKKPKIEHATNTDVEEEPPLSSDAISLMFKLLDGSRLERRFSKDAKIQVIFNFLQSKGVDMTNKRLISTFPRKEYSDPTKILSGEGIESGTALLIENK